MNTLVPYHHVHVSMVPAISRSITGSQKQIITIILVLIFAAALRTEAYTVSGILYYRSMLENPQQYAFSFTMSVQRCQWYMQVQWDDNTVDAWCDGTQGYKLMKGPFYGPTPVAAITPSAIPVDLPTSALTILWMAFASECEQRKLGTNHAIFPPEAASRVPYPCHMKLTKKPPILPLNITFFSSGTPRFGGGWDPPYDQGFPIGQYQVTSETNVSGITLPSMFIFVEYQPKPLGISTNDIRPVNQYRGELTAATSDILFRLSPPRITNEVQMLDFRFGSVPVIYSARDWLSKQAVMLMPEYLKWRDLHGDKNSLSARASRAFFTGTILIVVLYSAILVYCKVRMHEPKSH